MNSGVLTWLIDNPIPTVLVMVSLQITLLVLSSLLIARLWKLSGTGKHRIWVCATLLLIMLLPNYLLLPTWLAAQIPIKVASTESEREVPARDREIAELNLIESSRPAILRQTVPEPAATPTTDTHASDLLEVNAPAPNRTESVFQDTGSRAVDFAPIPDSSANETAATSSLQPPSQFPINTVGQQTMYGPNWLLPLAAIYCLVAMFATSRLAVGWWRLSRMERGGNALDSSSLAIALQAAKLVRLKRLPKIVSSLNVPTPMSWGILSPIVLLPSSFETWSPKCRKAVLMHELSHVARHDALYDLLARLCSIMYWFHPAVYFVTRALVNTREEATDERVIACGLTPATYARQLLVVAEQCSLIRDRDCLPAVQMASHSAIESRVRRILQVNRNLDNARPSWRSLLFVLCVMCLVLLAIPLRLIPSVSANLLAQDIETTARATTLFERVQSMELATTGAEAKPITIRGIVRKPDFTAAQAVVFCLHVKDSEATLLGRTTTDAQGHYSLTIAATDKQRHISLLAIDSLNYFGWLDGLSMSRTKVNRFSFILSENSGRVEGNLLGPGSKPISGIEVKISRLIEPIENALGCRVGSAPFDFKTVSDENGHFAIDGLPANVHAFVKINSDDWGCLRTFIGTSIDTPDMKQDLYRATSYFAGSAKIKLFPKIELKGTVVDREGNPIAGASIVTEAETTTDKDGAFSIRCYDPTAWGNDELSNYSQDFRVSPPANSRFVSTRGKLDRDQLSTRTIKPIVLQAMQRTWVSGRILSATTMQPLIGIEVRDKSNQTNLPASDLPASDDEGRFRHEVEPGQQEIRFTPPGLSYQEQRLFISDPKSRAVRQIDVFDNEPFDMGTILLDVDTDKAKPVTIRVVMSDGKPVPNCRVELSKFNNAVPGSGNGRHQASLVQANSIDQYILTDKQGTSVVKPALGWSKSNPFQNRPLPPNLQQNIAVNSLSISYPSESPRYFASYNLPDDLPTEVVEITLTEGAQFHGKVTLNGKPFEDISVELGLISTFAVSRSVGLTAQTDGQGEFLIFAPSEDRYAIQNLNRFPRPNWSFDFGAPIRPVATDDPLKFEFGEIKLLVGNRKIAGTVVDSQGKPIEGIEVRTKPAQKQIVVHPTSSKSRSNSEGKFWLTGLPDGPLTLDILAGNAQTTVDVEAEQSEIKVELPNYVPHKFSDYVPRK